MRIYIPTRGRVNNQLTYRNLTERQREDTWLVTTPAEAEALEMLGYQVLTCPVEGIARKRQWVVDQHDPERDGESLMMFDDDLRFSARREDDPTRFRKIDGSAEDLQAMFDELAYAFQHAPMVGISNRSGANRNLERWRLNTRIFMAWGVHVPTLRAEGVRLDRMTLMGDFDTNLQLLSRGYPTVAINHFTVDDKGSNTPGGCSIYRTDDTMRQAAQKLADLWPEFVTVVEKPGWKGMGETRSDVRVAWKRAYQFGETWRRGRGLPLANTLWAEEGNLL